MYGFLITNIFFIDESKSILSIKNFNSAKPFEGYSWEVHVNSEFHSEVKIIGEILVKRKTRYLDESAVEFMANLKGINTQLDKVELIKK